MWPLHLSPGPILTPSELQAEDATPEDAAMLKAEAMLERAAALEAKVRYASCAE